MHGNPLAVRDGAAQNVDTYIARVAHELRTPVSLIAGSLENLQESMDMLVRYVAATEKYLGRHDEAAQLRRELRLDYRIENTPGLLKICSEGAQRLSHVVEQMRRSNARSAARSDLVAVLRAAVAMASHDRPQPPRIAWFLPPGLGAVQGDEHSLGQVFLNIVRNAFDAVESVADPCITIAATRSDAGADGWVEVSVRDNGGGIAASVRDRIFDEFVTTKPTAAGIGLGLSISRDIIQSVGGEISLRASGPEGTEFQVRLPVAGSD